MPKISAVVITLNEETNLERCLSSLVSVADEILVIDSGSTDRTQQIAEQFEARFIPTKWLGYAATKNLGHQLARHPYILSLDADEELSEELQTEIEAHKESLQGAYEFNRYNYYLGKWIKRAGWYPDFKIRLFDKNKAQWQGDFVHETLVTEQGVPIHRLNGPMHHYSIQNVEQHKATVRKYARLAAEREKAAGKTRNLMKAISSAVFTYVKILFVKGGILEGRRGFLIARYSAWSKWLRYQYLK